MEMMKTVPATMTTHAAAVYNLGGLTRSGGGGAAAGAGAGVGGVGCGSGVSLIPE
ncbi:hypothetical protein MSEO_36280 [Mycobacterium seoulense]|uniref:Uncharacterized protein n=1 Tax=Mycobacterium seoulense TaxID=386911 RepID=A0A7I7P376_9MYCO|nr:hypothetical protein MSEO_36280 [Mycobacterium seoulense]